MSTFIRNTSPRPPKVIQQIAGSSITPAATHRLPTVGKNMALGRKLMGK